MSLGGGDGWAIMSGVTAMDASTPEDFDHRNLARVKKPRQVAVVLLLAIEIDRVDLLRAK